MKTELLRRVAGLVVQIAVGLALGSVISAQSSTPPSSAAGAVPQGVLSAFQRGYPAATLSAAGAETVDGATVYRIDCTDNGRKRVVRYKPDGSLIEVGDRVTEKELPAPVAAAMRSHPRATFGSGLKVTRGGNVHYELKLVGTRKTTMLVKPDGTVISFK